MIKQINTESHGEVSIIDADIDMYTVGVKISNQNGDILAEIPGMSVEHFIDSEQTEYYINEYGK